MKVSFKVWVEKNSGSYFRHLDSCKKIDYREFETRKEALSYARKLKKQYEMTGTYPYVANHSKGLELRRSF